MSERNQMQHDMTPATPKHLKMALRLIEAGMSEDRALRHVAHTYHVDLKLLKQLHRAKGESNA